MKRFITFTLAILAFVVAYAQSLSDSAKVVFARSSSRFDPDLGDNRAVMAAFLKSIREHEFDIDSIVVRGCASPEGGVILNQRLSRLRCDSVASYIIRNTAVNPSLVKTLPEGVAWNELTSLVEDTPEVPYRNEVLDILRNTPLWIFGKNNKVVDGRKRQLMRLHAGIPYNWMLRNLFPLLRNSVMVSVYCKAETFPEPVVAEQEIISQPMIVEPEPVIEEVIEEESFAVVQTPLETKPFHRFAIKTNLLYYAILMPNLELEGMINEKWSVALEGNIAWWSNKDLTRTYQIATVSPEVRFWFKTRDPWHGMFAGAFAGGGLFDLENRSTGYQGHGLFAGLSFGYMWPISRNFSFETSIGAGYLYSRYKEYIPDDGHFVYMRSKALNYFGPLKLKLSIVWRLADSNKSK